MTKKIALVYDWFDSWGGIERVLLVIHKHFPHIDFFTSYANENKRWWPHSMRVYTSFMQRLPSFIKHSRLFSSVLYPYAFESLNLDKYDMVISVTSSYSKGIIVKPPTRHISWILTPTRFLWHDRDIYEPKNPLAKLFYLYFTHKQRIWDYLAAQRPDKLYAISFASVERVRQYYHREAQYFPVPFYNTHWEKIKNTLLPPQKRRGYLLVGRLEKYKNVELALAAFTQLKNEHLTVVGTGREEEYLKSMAPPNVTFLGRVSEEQLGELYMCSEALIMPQEEDFGLVALEAQFFDCPVVAYGKGGAVETVLAGKTGVFFTSPTPQALIRAIEEARGLIYNSSKAQEHLKQFFEETFVKNFQKLIA